MLRARWRKVARDVWAERGRMSLMVAAVAVSLVAVGTVLGAYAILTREIAVNYLGTHPASATLQLHGPVDEALLAEVRAHPLVERAERRGVIASRVRVGEDWRPLLLFVVDDFADLRVSSFHPDAGAWPPPEGTVLIERTAERMVEAGVGDAMIVKTPHGEALPVPISGLVHDPGLAPAWQEREGYAYATQATVAALGEPDALDELRVVLRGDPGDVGVIEAQAAELAAWLGTHGVDVHEIRVPPPHQHPHQRQMETILVMMLAFGGMALVLSAILVATSLSAMLARQVREIGVMKTLGARTSQLAAMYAVLVAGLGAVAVAIAWPVATIAARGMAGDISSMLNFTLTDETIPAWTFAVVSVSGVVIPLLVSAVPIARACRITVRAALDQHGVAPERIRPGLSRLPFALRNALRRPSRLALTLSLLAAGGAMFTTALNVSRSWERNLEKVAETRHYDTEIRFHAPEDLRIADVVRAVPGVGRVEAWGRAPAALAKPGQVDVVRTWPDQSHGSLTVMAPPADTSMVSLPLREGRWLRADDTDAVVLNHSVLAQARGAKVGDSISISIDGAPSTWRIVGIVEEIGSPGVAYVTDAAFARVTGTTGRAGMLRVALDDGPAGTPAPREVEAALEASGAGVETVIPLTELRTAVGDHIGILIRALVAMAAVMATVGGLGLGSAMGVSVLERTREVGVMKTIGATPYRIASAIVGEAVAIAAMSWVLAVAASAPLTWFVDTLLGNLGFLAPLPFVMAAAPALSWGAVVVALAVVATGLPAWRASRMTIRDALVQL